MTVSKGRYEFGKKVETIEMSEEERVTAIQDLIQKKEDEKERKALERKSKKSNKKSYRSN